MISEILYCPFCQTIKELDDLYEIKHAQQINCLTCKDPFWGCPTHVLCGGSRCNNQMILDNESSDDGNETKRKRDTDETNFQKKQKLERKVQVRPLLVVKNQPNTVTPPPLRIGVATWNVNHFGKRAYKVKGTLDNTMSGNHASLSEQLKRMERNDLAVLSEKLRVPDGKTRNIPEKTLKAVTQYLKNKDRNREEEKAEKSKDDQKEPRQQKLSTEQRADAFIRLCAERIAKMKRAQERLKELEKICEWKPESTPRRSKRPKEEKKIGTSATALDFDVAFEAAKKSVSMLKGELKRKALARSIWRLFRDNLWLDVLLVQEANSFTEFQQTLDEEKPRSEKFNLSAKPGPQMISTRGSGQHEFYPIVYREHDAIKYENWFMIDQDGKQYEEKDLGQKPESADKGAKKFPTYTWEKHQKNATYRGVVFHCMTLYGQKVHFGSIHTTPGSVKDQEESETEALLEVGDAQRSERGKDSDREFYRPNEFFQLEKAFKLAAQAEEPKTWWILGGDYYIQPETLVRNPKELYKVDLETLDGLIEGELKEKTDAYLKKFNRSFSLKEMIVKTGRIDLVRNILEKPVTFKKVLPEALKIAYCVSGTNWHDIDRLWWEQKLLGSEDLKESERRARYYATARIADLFVYTKEHCKSEVTGLFPKEGKGIVLADLENDLPCSRHWSMMSDHFPVGAYFSSAKNDEEIWEIVNIDNVEAAKADAWLRKYRLAHRLAYLAHRFSKVDGLFDELRSGHPSWSNRLDGLIKAVGLPKDPNGSEMTTYEKYKLEDESGKKIWDNPNSPFKEPFSYFDAHDQWRLLQTRLIKFEEDLVKKKLLKKKERSLHEDFGVHAWGAEEYDDDSQED